MATILLAIGLVFVVEGLVFALVPGRLEELAALIARIPPETRRMIGLCGLGAGVVLIWLAKSLGA